MRVSRQVSPAVPLTIRTSHALRAGLDMNLHRALDKLADGSEPRTEAEERDLGESSGFARDMAADSKPVVSARIWLNCYMHDHLYVCSIVGHIVSMVTKRSGQCQLGNRQTPFFAGRLVCQAGAHPSVSATLSLYTMLMPPGDTRWSRRPMPVSLLELSSSTCEVCHVLQIAFCGSHPFQSEWLNISLPYTVKLTRKPSPSSSACSQIYTTGISNGTLSID